MRKVKTVDSSLKLVNYIYRTKESRNIVKSQQLLLLNEQFPP